MAMTGFMSWRTKSMGASKVIKNESKAYGYNYASLGDIVNQGQALPKMRIRRIEQDDYVEYFDGAEWQLGAKVVVPEMKGSNEAQKYGSALTYARRYTALMALSLACDDDTKIETTEQSAETESKPKKFAGKFDLKDADKRIKEAKSAVEVRAIYMEAPVNLRQYLDKGCERRIAELKGIK